MTTTSYDPARMTYDDATEARIAALLVGAIDPHVHTGPSIANRALDHLQLAQDASRVRMAAIVTKDHDYAGVMTAAMIASHHPELVTRVYSSVALNNVVGGLNPYAVEHTAAMGGKICWLPTLTAVNHLRWEKESGRVHPASTSKIRPASAVEVTDAAGNLNDGIKAILDVLARTGMTMATGHLHISEIWKVVEEAERRGVKRIILTHPEEFIQASLNDVAGLTKKGVYAEHSLCLFVPGSKFCRLSPELLKQQIEAAGVDRTIMCSDAGQTGVLHPVEMMRQGIKLCMELGYSDGDIRKMFSTNAATVLGLEADVERVTGQGAA